MESATQAESISALDFPTANPILDVLRPLPSEAEGRLTTGDYFFVSSAIILAFTELAALRQFLDSISSQSAFVFLVGILGLPLAAFGGAFAVHIGGHLIAARFTGFDAVRIKFGGLAIKAALESEDVLSLGPIVARPRGNERLRFRLAWLALGGPLANLLAPLLPEIVLRLTEAYIPGKYLLLPAGVHLFAALSLLAGIGTLLPDIDSSGNFSDGTRLLMLLKNDLRATRLLAMMELQLRLKSGESPRGWGDDLVAQVAAEQDESFDTVAANWLAYLWAARRQDLGAATQFLEAALASLGPSPGHLRDRIFLEAAIFQGWFRHNLVKAKLWESQIAHFYALPELERKRLEIALYWADGKSFEAWEALDKLLHCIGELPPSALRTTAEADLLEWKTQMGSRLLAGAWATMHSWPHQRRTQRVM